MDKAYSPSEVYEQFNVKWFNDAAAQCAEHCIKTYESKELNAPERTCVNTCFKKQMVIMGGVQSVFTGSQ